MKQKNKEILLIIAIALLITNFFIGLFNNCLIKIWASESKYNAKEIKRVERMFSFEWYTRGYRQAEKDFKLRSEEE